MYLGLMNFKLRQRGEHMMSRSTTIQIKTADCLQKNCCRCKSTSTMTCQKTSLCSLFWKYPRFRSSFLCYIHRDKVCMWQSFFPISFYLILNLFAKCFLTNFLLIAVIFRLTIDMYDSSHSYID